MSFQWDPSPIAYTVPGLNWPIYWYGIFFALGLLLSAYIAAQLLKSNVFTRVPEKEQTVLLDTFFVTSFLGILIGARLAHVFFYDWTYYEKNPLHILFIWEGGLASHGGVLGLLVACWYVTKKKQPVSTISHSHTTTFGYRRFVRVCSRLFHSNR